MANTEPFKQIEALDTWSPAGVYSLPQDPKQFSGGQQGDQILFANNGQGKNVA
jgi:hypothetical protein